MQKINGLILIFIIFLNTSIVLAKDISGIGISHLWISEAPPTVSVLVAYVTLKNNSTKTASLISVSSPLFSSIEIHRSIVKDDVASMERYSSLTIPAKSTIKLLPGDYHLMLFNPKTPLEIGDRPTLTFTFSNGVKIPVKAHVKKRKYNEH